MRDGRPDYATLTMDHVVPKAQATDGYVRLPWTGKRVPTTSWENLVTACHACNGKKGSRTPSQANMQLATIPRKPSPIDGVRLTLARLPVPDEWLEYVGTGA